MKTLGFKIATLMLSLQLLSPAVVAADELISGQAVNHGAGVPIMLEGIDKATLVQISIDGRPSDDCMIDVASLRGQFAAGLAKGSLQVQRAPAGAVEVTINLKKSTSSSDDGKTYLTCKGDGDGCKAKVIVPDPTGPLQKLLP